MATYYVELDGGQLTPDAALKGGTMSAAVSFSGAVIYPTGGGGSIIISDTIDPINGGTIRTITAGSVTALQTKTASYTPSETAISATILPDQDYDGLTEVGVEVGAIPSNYVGTGVTRKAAQTYTPGTADQTIASGQYLDGAQTILGDADLVAGNIKKDVEIFGVTGTYEGGGGSTDNSVLKLVNFFCSSKWCTASSVPSVFGNGGCLHVKVQENFPTGTSDAHLVSFARAGTMTSWTPSDANMTVFFIGYHNGGPHTFRFRSTNINATIDFKSNVTGIAHDFYHNGIAEIKLYANKVVDVSTGTEYAFSEVTNDYATISTAMSYLSGQSTLSIGQNQTAPLSGFYCDLFAFEES